MPYGVPPWMTTFHDFNDFDVDISNDTTPYTNLTSENCTDGVPWIKTLLGQCVLTDRNYASVMCGLGSTLISTVNGLPQIYTNCAQGIPDKALSIFLIVQWFAGDALNLLGCFLAHQTFVQIIYAIFMVSLDVIMFTQYSYFKIKHSYEEKVARNLLEDSLVNSTSEERRPQRTGMYCVTAIWGLIFLGQSIIPREQTIGTRSHPGGRSLLSLGSPNSGPFFLDVTDEVGFGIGCVSTAFYISSRAPQIYQNWKRKTTQGVSIWLFLLLIVSNCLYGSSILCHSTDLHDVLHSLPWLIGAFGMVSFDLVIMWQFWYYRPGSVNELKINEGDETSPLLNGTISVSGSHHSVA